MFWKKPSPAEVVNKILDKYVTKEQLSLLTNLYNYKNMDIKEEIMDSAIRMKSKYSIKKSLKLAETTIKYLNLDHPTINDRVSLRHLFTRKLLKG